MEEKFCRVCGIVCPADFKFCPNCGADLQTPKCANCGEELIEGAKFCVNCGAHIGAQEESAVSDNCHEAEESVEDEQNTCDVETNSDSILSDNSVKSVYEAHVGKSEKPNRLDKQNKNYILRIVKNASVLVLCTILFALSFCGIATVNADSYLDGLLDTGIENCEASLSAVDVIGSMFSTASVDGDEKYQEELYDIIERLEASVLKDYNPKLDRVVLSDKSKALISDAMVCYLKLYLSNEEAKGDVLYNNVIIAGTLCLLNILFSASMLIVSIISLLFVLLKKKNKVSKFLYAMPAYLFISLMILFLVKTSIGIGAGVAGAMGATLFFEIVAIIATVVLIFSATKKKVIKNAIPKLVSIAVSLVICACLFAPAFTAKYDLVLKNKTSRNTYTVSLDAGGLLTYLSPSETDEYENIDFGELYDSYMNYIEYIIDDLSDTTLYQFNHSEGEIATRLIMSMLVIAGGNYSAVGALSIGYYILLLAFMAFGAFAVWSVASLFKADTRMYSLIILAMLLIIVSLACSVGWICVMNYHLEDLALSFTVGGGLISAIILSFMTLIFSNVFDSVASGKKRSIKYEDSEIADDERTFA